MKIKPPRHLSTLLKLTLSAVCLWYALRKPDWSEMLRHWKRTDLGWVLLSLGLYSLSKILASNRLNVNFKLAGLEITNSSNLRLYWLGMLYNLMLPGAVTGDAYKVVRLGKNPGQSRMALTWAVLLDRFSGLLTLLVIIALLGWWALGCSRWTLLFLIGSLGLIPLSYVTIRKILPLQAQGFMQTLWMGAGVQTLVVSTILSLIMALGLSDRCVEYLLVFLTAAAVSVLPVSVGGGLGIREFASIQGAHWMGLPVEETLLLSLVFYGTTVLTALPGLAYIFRDPLRESN